MLRRFINDERGATAIEYALIAAFMFIGCVTAFYAFGESSQAMFDKISEAVAEVTNR